MYAGAACAVFVFAGCLPAAAQETPSPSAAPAEGVLVFTPDYFASALPNTALEMIGRLPGFSFDGGDQVRGFAGAAGNVLINGQRPTAKSDSLSDIVSRIPASQVERIELIRGGAPGIDMQGRTVIANVITKKTDSFTQVVSVSNHLFLETGDNLPGWRYEARGTSGERTWELALSRGVNMNDSVGRSVRQRFDADGDLLYSEYGATEGDGAPHSVRGFYRTPALGGAVRVSGVLSAGNFKDETYFDRSGLEIFNLGRDSGRNAELGLNYDRKLGSRWELEALALQKVGENEFVSIGKTGESLTRYTSDVKTGESIARGVVRYVRSEALRLEGGAETAFNFREGLVSLNVDGTPIAVPAADVRVEELRGEAFVQGTWRTTPRLTLEGGVRVERSTISQSGDTSKERSFTYPKPRFVATWTPRDGEQLRFRVEREVGQLNFGAFVSSANLTTGLVSAGNADLAPDQTWVYELAAEKRFWGKGAVVIELRHEQITDVIDRAPFFGADPDGSGPLAAPVFDSPANIGDGTNNELEIALTLPLDRIGVAGGEFQADVTLRDSEVTDPTTGEKREISGLRNDVVELEFRQDLPQRKLTWGASYYAGWDETHYRYNEIAKSEIRTFVQGFIEYKPTQELSLLIELSNGVPFEFIRERQVYSGPRSTAPLSYVEVFETQSQRRLFARLRKTF